MTQLLEKAFSEAARLTETEQDAFASLLLAELDAEQKWARRFVDSPEKLAQLAREALLELQAPVSNWSSF